MPNPGLDLDSQTGTRYMNNWGPDLNSQPGTWYSNRDFTLSPTSKEEQGLHSEPEIRTRTQPQWLIWDPTQDLTPGPGPNSCLRPNIRMDSTATATLEPENNLDNWSEIWPQLYPRPDFRIRSRPRLNPWTNPNTQLQTRLWKSTQVSTFESKYNPNNRSRIQPGLTFELILDFQIETRPVIWPWHLTSTSVSGPYLDC